MFLQTSSKSDEHDFALYSYLHSCMFDIGSISRVIFLHSLIDPDDGNFHKWPNGRSQGGI